MSGGQKISDHGGYAKDSDALMKSKTHVKHESSASGAGAVGKYEDTTEAIKGVQMAGDGKIRGHKMKDGYRY